MANWKARQLRPDRTVCVKMREELLRERADVMEGREQARRAALFSSAGER